MGQRNEIQKIVAQLFSLLSGTSNSENEPNSRFTEISLEKICLRKNRLISGLEKESCDRRKEEQDTT